MIGICAGSEKQGGQHEGRDKPVQAAASYFSTLTADGQNRDLVNIWRNVDIEGGDHNGTVSKCMSFDKYALQLIPTFYKARELDDKTDQKNTVDRVIERVC